MSQATKVHTVLDECQISSSEYKVLVGNTTLAVLDECQISSSEYSSWEYLRPSQVLDECQISSSEYDRKNRRPG